MTMLSGRMHWLTMGLALLVGAHGLTSTQVLGQAPSKPASAAAKRGAYAGPAGFNASNGAQYGMPPAGVMQASARMSGGMMIDSPGSMSFPGPAPGEIQYACDGCDSSCDSMGGCGGCGGCNSCGGMACGGRGCGIISGLRGRLGSRMGGCGQCGGMGCGACAGMGCGQCGGAGCGACGGMGSNGCLLGGRLLGLLGPLAPYSEGGRGAQRYFDLYAGTIGLTRTSNFGGFSSAVQDIQTGEFLTSDIVSTNGISGTPVLRTTDVDMDQMRYGLELIASLQTGVGSNLEVRYFGLNNWDVSESASRDRTPGNNTLFSVFSNFGTSPAGGFDDTDRSFVHSLNYRSELHNGELNFRRRWVSPMDWAQGSWLAGVRYFDLDERFGFDATGSNDNTFTFSQLRFFNYETRTRNQLTGFQLGGDFWVNVVPGIQMGVEGKAGIFGNHAEVESALIANSVPGAREFMQTGRTAYLAEFSASTVYRLTYAWSVRASYNLLYVDNVALAPENFNVRGVNSSTGTPLFTADRFPMLDVDGEVFYQGWSIGGEFLF